MNKQTNITQHASEKKLFVTRDFNGSVQEVWDAWTKPELLDQWWAPKPWKAETKSMDFRPGGVWLYSMVGPDGERHHCRADYDAIVPQKEYSGSDAFCDENGNPTNELPSMDWHVQFEPVEQHTRVSVQIGFASEEDMNKIIEMGFKEGFTAAHGNLDELLAKK